MKVTANDVAQLLAGSPPRQVPVAIAKASAASGGCFLLLFGIIFGSFGMVFVVALFPWRFIDDWQLASDHARTTPGVVNRVQKTGMSINKIRVMEYFFNYTPADGLRREGHCFTTGNQWSENNAVTIRYLSDKPEVASIEGARLSEGGWGSAFVILFPLVGGGLVRNQRPSRNWKP